MTQDRTRLRALAEKAKAARDWLDSPHRTRAHPKAIADCAGILGEFRSAASPDAILALLDERDALAADARRYRFIRDADRSGHLDHELRLYAMETLDEYVDAALEDEAALDGAKEAT